MPPVQIMVLVSSDPPLVAPQDSPQRTVPIRIPSRHRRGLTIGQRILVRTDSKHKHARWIARIHGQDREREPEQALGVVCGKSLRLLRKGRQRLIPLKTQKAVPDGAIVDGAIVRAELHGRRHQQRAQLLSTVTHSDEKHVYAQMAIEQAAIPHTFSPAVTQEVSRLKALEHQPPRTDLRDLGFVTIDGADARDHDDAVWVEEGGDGAFTAWVAIADVAHYVRPGSALDREAQSRGNSTYFPDLMVPMLPEVLAQDLCSLREGQPRPVLAVEMTITPDGTVQAYRFVRGTIQSQGRLIYDSAHTHPLYPALQRLNGALEKARRLRGTLEISTPEPLIDQGQLSHRPHLEAHRVIENLMIAANVCAAKALDRLPEGKGTLYRCHPKPSALAVEEFLDGLNTLGIRARRGATPSETFKAALQGLEADQPLGIIAQELVMRAQNQACYQPNNIGHFGLQLTHYAHFTSPIRRYSDLVTHRALIEALGLGEGGAVLSLPALTEIGEAISATERRSMNAERACLRCWQAQHYQGHIGAEIDVFVTAVHRAGVFVRLDAMGTEAFVPLRTMPSQGRSAKPRQRSRASGEQGLGSAFTVKITEADPLTGGITAAWIGAG